MRPCSMRPIAIVLSSLAALLGTACSVPEGRFACTTSAQCPSGFVCRSNGLCYATPDPEPTLDAGVPLDAPGLDAHAPDLDALALDAPGLDAFAPLVDAPGEDAPELDAARSPDAAAFDAGPGAACGGASVTCQDTVAAGGFSTCVIRGSEVHCWGLDQYGALGSPTGAREACPGDVEGRMCRNRPAVVEGGSALVGARVIEGGERTFCALVSEMTPVCWGLDLTAVESETPFAGVVGVRGWRGATQISLRYPMAFVISSAFVLGEDREGSGVHGGGGSPPAPGTRIAGANTVVPGGRYIESGWNHVCAIDAAGAVQCWGKNVHGELGNGATANSTVPVPATELMSGAVAAELALADASTCVLTEAGRVVCWGWNQHGELGRGVPEGPTAPVLRDDTEAPLTGIVQLDAGFWHVCARDSTGQVWCWGRDEDGQVGDGPAADVFCAGARCVPRARRVLGLDDAVDLSCGTMHSCALRENGEVVCWGDNQFGELGTGDYADRDSPVAVRF